MCERERGIAEARSKEIKRVKTGHGWRKSLKSRENSSPTSFAKIVQDLINNNQKKNYLELGEETGASPEIVPCEGGIESAEQLCNFRQLRIHLSLFSPSRPSSLFLFIPLSAASPSASTTTW